MADPATRSVHAIAIQKPWPNTTKNMTVSQSSTCFLPLYPTNMHTRACFLLNTNIYQPGQWTVHFPHPDVVILSLKTTLQVVHIVNIYSPCPRSSGNEVPESAIHDLPALLADYQDGHIIFVGDFNVHHTAWNPPHITDTHVLALELLQSTGACGLGLITPPGIKTWECGSSWTTLDLAFVPPSMEGCLVSCSSPASLCHGSNHHPILSTFDCQANLPASQPKYKWKAMDQPAIQAASSILLCPLDFTSTAQIDQYAQYLQWKLLKIAKETVPCSSRLHGQKACTWWTPEIEDLVHEERRLRRSGADSNSLKTASRAKKKAIKQEKRHQFHNWTHQLKEDPQTLW